MLVHNDRSMSSIVVKPHLRHIPPHHIAYRRHLGRRRHIARRRHMAHPFHIEPAMSEPPPDVVSLFCWFIGENSSFRVIVARDDFVDDLKYSISSRKFTRLQGISDDDLKLFRVDIPDTDEEREAFKCEGLKPLPSSKKIATLFEGDPAEDTIHVAVLAPGK